MTPKALSILNGSIGTLAVKRTRVARGLVVEARGMRSSKRAARPDYICSTPLKPRRVIYVGWFHVNRLTNRQSAHVCRLLGVIDVLVDSY